MKAWIVTDDENSCVVFAEKRGQAKQAARGEVDADYIDLSARRAPQYDKYSPGPVPVTVLLADGWFFECSGTGCFHRVYETGCAERCSTDGPEIAGQLAYCGVGCGPAAHDQRHKEDDAHQGQ